MFSKEVTGLILASPVASGLFQNITGNQYRSDESFLATLRALLHSRVPKEESVTLRFTRSTYTAGNIAGSAPKDCVSAFIHESGVGNNTTGTLLIHSFDAGSDDNVACFSVLADGVSKALTGYKLMKDLSEWVEASANFRADVYINEEKKNTIVFTEQINIKRWHLLESLMTRYFPWYFRDAPLNEQELNLVKTLTRRYAPDYEVAIEEMSKKFDFRTEIIRTKLKGFDSLFDRKKLENTQSEIVNLQYKITDLENTFSTYYQQLNEARIREMGLTEKINRGGGEESREMMDFFLANKILHLISVDRGCVEFIVATTMDNFDPDAALSLINNSKSFFYNTNTLSDMTRERKKRLLKAIFVDETMKIRICAAYRLNFDNGRFVGVQGYSFPTDIIMDHTPNQHIQKFHCLGQNDKTIRESMLNDDYVGAVAACIQSAKSVNVTENITTGDMIEELFSNPSCKMIQMPDGTAVTPLEAAIWLEEHDVKKKKTKKGQEGDNE